MRYKCMVLLIPVLMPVLTACVTSDAPLTWKEGRDLAWQSRVVRTHFREAQSRADQQRTNGTLVVFPNRGAASRDLSATLLVGKTPGAALLGVPTAQRDSMIANATCEWITGSSVLAAPLRLSCYQVLEDAALLDQTDELSARARGLAIEFDGFKETATFLSDGLAKVLQLTMITDARATNLDETVKLVGDSSLKANTSLQTVTTVTRDLVKAMEAEHAEFARQLADIQNRVAAIK